MYISDWNKKQARKKARRVSFFVITGFIFLTEVGRTKEDEVLPLLFVCVVIGFISSFIFAPFISFIFARNLQKKDDKGAIIARQNREYEEEMRYRRDLERRMEQKRMELAIEFEHLQKIAMLKSQQDNEKMRMLAQLQYNIENAKENDLAKLDAQIQRMKREL